MRLRFPRRGAVWMQRRTALRAVDKPKRVLPLEEDCALLGMAERLGLRVERREGIEVVDMAALDAAWLTKKTTVPDYAKIRRCLFDGITVSGARVTGMEYVLRRKDGYA